MRLLTRYADVSAVLADLRFVVPAPPPGWRPATVGWLRATVSRFSTGETHERRRAMVTGMLAGLDPAAVRQAAFDRVVGAPDRVTGAVDPAVPVRILASMLGVPGAAVEVAVDAVAAVAPAYQPGSDVDAADEAVGRLVTLLGGADEWTANRIGVLVQAYQPTAGLVANAVRAMGPAGPRHPVDAVLAETLRHDPPVRQTMRVVSAAALIGGVEIPAGAAVRLDLAAANRDPAVFASPERFDPGRPDRDAHLTFGAGLRPCPGGIALALVAGLLQAALPDRVG